MNRLQLAGILRFNGYKVLDKNHILAKTLPPSVLQMVRVDMTRPDLNLYLFGGYIMTGWNRKKYKYDIILNVLKQKGILENE